MKINYSNKYVAFIDVLGFTELVNSNSKEKLEKYFELVDLAFEIFKEHKSHLTKLSISDSIILIAEDTPESFQMLLQSIKTLQSLLARRDIWARGGISFGEVYFNRESNIIVGKGFISAYLLENEANFPRVIVDPHILTKLNLTRREFYERFNGSPHTFLESGKLIHDYGLWNSTRFTEDDAIFVCYANRIVIRSTTDVPFLTEGEEKDLDLVYSNIRKNLYSTQKHYSKYLWLKKYFQEVIKEYGELQKNNNVEIHSYLESRLVQFMNL